MTCLYCGCCEKDHYALNYSNSEIVAATVLVCPSSVFLVSKETLDSRAVALGRLGGLAGKGVSTPAKRRAARANGKKGGRPPNNKKKGNEP